MAYIKASGNVSNNQYTVTGPNSYGAIGAGISITSGSSGLNGLSINELLHPVISSHVKKYEIYEFQEDVLALSVTWKRMRDSGEFVASKLTDDILFKKLTAEDKVNADAIRDYYSKKIMMMKLAGDSRFTSFREDLNIFVHGDKFKMTNNFFGLAYYLPTFYDYDTKLDEVKQSVTSKFNWKVTGPKLNSGSVELTPIKKLHRKTKGTDVFQYWLKTSDNIAALICVQPSNSLIKLWDHFYNLETPLKIRGSLTPRRIDGLEYVSITNWDIVHG